MGGQLKDGGDYSILMAGCVNWYQEPPGEIKTTSVYYFRSYMGKLMSISRPSVKYKAIARTQQIEINRETGDRGQTASTYL